MKRKRTNPPAGTVPVDTGLMMNLRVLSETMSRSGLARMLGQQFGGDRDLYAVLGYPLTITRAEMRGRYERGDIAKRIVNAPVQTTWRGKVTITENQKGDATPLEKQYSQMDRDLHLTNKYVRLDKLVGLGQYAVMLIGFDDGLELKEPVTARPGMKVNYLMPYSQENAPIAEYETDVNNPRFGKPKSYDLKMKTMVTTGATSTTQTSTSIRVHWSRVIHVAEGTLEDEVLGTPRLEAVWNRLMDVDKIVGGSGEMYWKGARPGYAAQADPEAQLMPDDVTALKTQFSEFEHGLSRWLRTQGIEIKSLAPQVSDPSNHLDVQLTMISAATGIPKRILSGSERGELASAQDEKNWLTLIADRREEYAEPMVVRAFIDRLMEYGALPEAVDGDYEVEFVDLFSASEKDRASVAKTIAETLATYANSLGSEEIMPVEFFLKRVLSLTAEEVEEISDLLKQAMEEEDALGEIGGPAPAVGVVIDEQPTPEATAVPENNPS